MEEVEEAVESGETVEEVELEDVPEEVQEDIEEKLEQEEEEEEEQLIPEIIKVGDKYKVIFRSKKEIEDQLSVGTLVNKEVEKVTKE